MKLHQLCHWGMIEIIHFMWQGLALWPQPNTNYVAGPEQSSYISILGAETPGVSHHPHTSQVLSTYIKHAHFT